MLSVPCEVVAVVVMVSGKGRSCEVQAVGTDTAQRLGDRAGQLGVRW